LFFCVSCFRVFLRERCFAARETRFIFFRGVCVCVCVPFFSNT
jgi:hypothetical protein